VLGGLVLPSLLAQGGSLAGSSCALLSKTTDLRAKATAHSVTSKDGSLLCEYALGL